MGPRSILHVRAQTPFGLCTRCGCPPPALGAYARIVTDCDATPLSPLSSGLSKPTTAVLKRRQQQLQRSEGSQRPRRSTPIKQRAYSPLLDALRPLLPLLHSFLDDGDTARLLRTSRTTALALLPGYTSPLRQPPLLARHPPLPASPARSVCAVPAARHPAQSTSRGGSSG